MATIANQNLTPEFALESVTRLLIIDDDEKLCDLLKEYLGPLGYAVDIVHNGIEGSIAL